MREGGCGRARVARWLVREADRGCRVWIRYSHLMFAHCGAPRASHVLSVKCCRRGPKKAPHGNPPAPVRLVGAPRHDGRRPDADARARSIADSNLPRADDTFVRDRPPRRKPPASSRSVGKSIAGVL